MEKLKEVQPRYYGGTVIDNLMSVITADKYNKLSGEIKKEYAPIYSELDFQLLQHWFIQADRIVRKLAEEADSGDYLSKKIYGLIDEARTYITNNPNKEGGEGE